MVLATYDTVAAEFSKSEGEGVFNQVHWHRLILDEGTTNEPSRRPLPGRYEPLETNGMGPLFEGQS